MTRACCARVLAAGTVFAARMACADAGTALQGRLGTSVDNLAFPSLWRVLLGFILTVGLAVAVMYALRRVRPSLLRGSASQSDIRVVDRSTVSPSLTVYLVEVAGSRLVIAEGRNGVAVGAMPPAAEHSGRQE